MTAGRQYGSIRTDIWRDDDWRALSVDAQWLYELLISQPTISTAGILPLQIAKWSRYAKGMTAKRVNAALNELIDADFVAVDSETEEVLVRTFIRHDAARAGTPRGRSHTARIAGYLAVTSSVARLIRGPRRGQGAAR